MRILRMVIVVTKIRSMTIMQIVAIILVTLVIETNSQKSPCQTAQPHKILGERTHRVQSPKPVLVRV